MPTRRLPITGPTATHQLLRAGWTSRQLSRAVVTGELVRVRQGWYCEPAFAELRQRAMCVGGQLTCQPAAALLGLAVRHTDILHVSVPRNSARLRNSRDPRAALASPAHRDTIVHWSSKPGALAFPPVPLTPLEVATDLATCESPEFTIAAVDSGIRLGLIRRDEWMRFVATLPHARARLLAQVDGHSESITESLCRFRLCALGISPRLQVKIQGVGFVDMLIGERLIVEIDGRKYHSDTEQFETDRRRDALLSVLGYRVLRFSYRQVMSQWAQVQGSILAAMARGDHQA